MLNIATFMFLVLGRLFIVEPFTIPASSMEPTLRVGDTVLVSNGLMGMGHSLVSSS